MIYKIKNDAFEPKDVFECGQCFRWNKEKNDSYTGVFHNMVLNVEKLNEEIVFKTLSEEFKEKSQENFENIIKEYFDLDRDYSKIRENLSRVDDNLKTSIEYGKGIRILNQDLWEMIISFIISANNNIPRIKGIIEKISETYGNEIPLEDEKISNRKYYTFPTPEQLSKATVEDLRKTGLGFRDIRVYETTQMIVDKKVNLDSLTKMTTEEAREQLLTLSGVGPKVADCILLFSTLKRFDVFPIDVWVRRVMNDLYIHNPEESKINKKDIQKMADEKFGNLQGIAQQYLFYWKREA